MRKGILSRLLLIGVTILLGGIPTSVYAISVTAQVDRQQVPLSGQIVLEVVIEGESGSFPKPQLPPLPNFRIYSGGSSQQVSITNGRVSGSLTHTYVLSPQKTGNYTIGPIEIQYQRKVYRTNPINIEVIADSAAPPAATSSPAASPQITGQPHPESLNERPAKNIFITTSLDKKQCYVNEPVTLTFLFYHRVRLLSNPEYNPPDTTGFWSEDLPPQRNYQTEIQGQPFIVNEIKTALFPTAPGEYTIGSATLRCNVEDFAPQDFFQDDFFRGFFSRGKTQVLTSTPLKIKVLPLPDEDKPANFTGAVGDFSLKASLDKQQVETGQPVTLTINVTGRGNIKSIQEPSYEPGENFRRYDTVSSQNISKNNYQVSGNKEFKIVLIPRTPGTFTLPKVNFSFFNPQKKRYITLHSSELTLRVTPGKTPVQGTPFSSGGEMQVYGKDIRFLHLRTKLISFSGWFYQKPIFRILILLPLGGLILLAVYRFGTRCRQMDPLRYRAQKAYRKARRQWQRLNSQSSSLDRISLYSELTALLRDYLQERFNLPPGLTTSEIIAELEKLGRGKETLNSIRELLVRSEEIRFAPDGEKAADWQGDLRLLKELIGRLEKEKNNR